MILQKESRTSNGSGFFVSLEGGWELATRQIDSIPVKVFTTKNQSEN